MIILQRSIPELLILIIKIMSCPSAFIMVTHGPVSDAQERLSVTHDPVSVNQERVSLCHSGTRFCDPERLCMYLWLRNPPLGPRSAFPELRT